MQNYELMLLMNPNISDEVDEILDNIKKTISDNKGDLEEVKLLGKRQLAYPINNMNYANYVHLNAKINAETLVVLEEMFKFEQNIFRHLTVKIGK
ncbi:MAG: 30S ribosomal protein S6 [SAR86 cluster bacterium]|uniref:Small ribosomal subunit protein bS6 n=1 Tax=SAR86 cluster bacterium TaxID=2030880 RepID=A0A368BNC5_9GAMM|nr:MAG: 30S ribosomal protein S6 [SAR86 cluster bacterium]|tara:strand:+ start:4112 stop:4396 length:285 start_codon:yes stop_codon:yes gene_type:complete